MKIAVISTSKIPSTTANSIQVIKVCQSYVQLGHEVLLFVPGHHKQEFALIQRHYGITKIFDIQWLKTFPSFHRYDFALKSFIGARKWHADLIHTWTPQTAWLAAKFKIPYLMEFHELPSGKLGPLLFKQIIFNQSKKRLLMITNALLEKYELYYGQKINQQDIIISPDGVDIERYRELPDPSSARKKLGLPDVFTGMYTGHFYQGRGMNILIALAQNFPEAQFLWVGGRELEINYWKETIKNLGLSNIVLTGFVDNSLIPEYQAAGDILLMPYEKNIAGSSGGNTADFCSPMKMFEYMAAKRVIISSNLPVIHEVLNENNAVFCDPEKPEEWISEFNKLRSQEVKRKSFAEKAYQDVQKYSWLNRAQNSLEGFINAEQ